ncbi:hypothetical protein SAMN02745164_02100 [Marinitoga hydrogenitolerans DSM 16785]|uniref:Uncharacterized protein n=1 Tax=Marinitoga hydrogenitolerans (strain DSM 16785 / JCM 12826 / AT1271) TaxID=1122195 RepID=A0A1M5A5Q4_MARH1|nr:hypothetical protein [Marinitoga hydrogenitolerans]SHF25467.1 hypothetical protein SAMN02745164_02100 [Marinitoga hydrogenitolerans DSM 16785]
MDLYKFLLDIYFEKYEQNLFLKKIDIEEAIKIFYFFSIEIINRKRKYGNYYSKENIEILLNELETRFNLKKYVIRKFLDRFND